MMKKKLLYIFSLMLAAGCVLQSCSDDLLDPSEGSVADPDQPKYSLNFVMTLDKMEVPAFDEGYNPMEEIENYIDPSRCRILFFDNEENFLFESKSRWVNKLGAASDYTDWFVAVPFYDTGNDTDEGWDWDYIRGKLTGGKFKIVVLANRSTTEAYPDLSKHEDENRNPMPKHFENAGPYWGADDTGKKKLIDLHHTQWDPIYTDKGARPDAVKAAGQTEGYYDFIMDFDDKAIAGRERLMSSSASWVDHGATLQDNAVYGPAKNRRRFRLPSKDYPIPMYGVQEFDPLVGWVEGTPFNLSNITTGDLKGYNHQTISLLRSVVRCDLLIAKSAVTARPAYVCMRYINIYSRCEPMDVWTPTSTLWKASHVNDCEWKAIMDYGAIATKDTPDNGFTSAAKVTAGGDTRSFTDYRQRISWLYGAWTDLDDQGNPRWDFKKLGGVSKVQPKQNGYNYPHIFNPLIQRNLVVMVDQTSGIADEYKPDKTDKYEAYAAMHGYNYNYYHYIIYCGERNVNDPSDLFNIGNAGSGKPTVQYWMFNVGNDLYSVPMMDYNSSNAKYYLRTANAYSTSTEQGNTMGGSGNLEYDLMQDPRNKNIMPWPLIRNHVYTIKVGKKNTGEGGAYTPKSNGSDTGIFDIESSVGAPTDIHFHD